MRIARNGKDLMEQLQHLDKPYCILYMRFSDLFSEPTSRTVADSKI